MTTTSIQDKSTSSSPTPARCTPKQSNASNRATSATPQKRPGVLPNAPLTPCYSARTGEPPGPTGLTSDGLDDLVFQIQPRHRYRADTTAASANCTALVLHWRMQPAHRAPHQGNRRVHRRRRDPGHQIINPTSPTSTGGHS